MTNTNLSKKKRISAVLVNCFLLCFILSIQSSFAADKLATIELQIKTAKGAQNKQTKQQKLLEKLVANAEKETAIATLKVQQTKETIQLENSRLKQLIEQTAILEEDKIKQQKLLEQQLISSYMTGQTDLIKLILNQEDISKIIRAKSYYQYLNKARLESINALYETQQQLENNKSAQADSLLALTGLYERQKVSAEALLEQRAERSKALKELNQDLNYQYALLAQLGDQAQNLKEKLRKQSEARQKRELAAKAKAKAKALKNRQSKSEEKTNSNIAKGKEETYSNIAKQLGQLNWPIQGEVLSRFGSQRSGQVTWKGITIEANEGEKVQAVASGRVLFAGYFKGYGMVLALDHSDGYISLYGYNQTLLQETGDLVLQGDTIALAGHSGGQDNNSLYFELSHKGTAKDPLLWLKKKHN
ncbi:peptidase M23B [Psychromonas ingrahamii 37]|uniref:Peptidase M23B n=1 Tax=Psychromonas ingrahamii (strain DSM 17664 / CCUG 51855 / 37) TaxID=357804 RepID=A1SZI4_PSYIN|nr:peptidoglycan DD-metalloendopeptidase family protein [Psychromonas ingrahamii]ABM04899.1 peptidase M23B [Psychromonas ingrahamii 37]